MSALAGIVRLDGQAPDPSVLQRMCACLVRYGPDAQGTRVIGPAAMVNARLHVTAQDSNDRQPLWHEPSQTMLAFDGRLDNRDELAHALGVPASDVERLPDSELALQACLQWDTQAVERMRGDFAIACWQSPRRRLWLARDPMGQRPLFWHRQAHFMAFGSVPKALRTVPGVPWALCEERLHDHLCTLPQAGSASFFKDIYRVEPGTCVLMEDGRVRTQRVHHFEAVPTLHLRRDEDYVEALREQLERAVAVRLRSSGLVASQLSSGFDSSAVTALAARQLAGRGLPLLAYTAVPREGFLGLAFAAQHADESAGAGALAALFPNISHVLVRPDGTSPIDHLPHDVHAVDRPIPNPCNQVWINAIQARAAQRGAKVLLTGQRGNATISYTGLNLLSSLAGQGHWLRWWWEAQALHRPPVARPWRGLLGQTFRPFLSSGQWAMRPRRQAAAMDFSARSAISPEFMARMDTTQRVADLRPAFAALSGSDGRRMRAALLVRGDLGELMLGANEAGLDVRDPTADLDLAEFCLSVPDDQYLRAGQTRWLLQRGMAGMLSQETMVSRTKGLQAADWYETAATALPRMRETVRGLEAGGVAGQYLDLNALKDLLDRWPTQGWQTPAVYWAYRRKLLQGLSVGEFIHQLQAEDGPIG